MTDNPLPNLGEWHEVPTDTDIPAGVRYVYLSRENDDWDTSTNFRGRTAVTKVEGGRYFTAEPIPARGRWLRNAIASHAARWDYQTGLFAGCYCGNSFPNDYPAWLQHVAERVDAALTKDARVEAALASLGVTV